MRTTNKQRTIKACEALAWKYRHPKGQVFFDADYCPLCDIHFDESAPCECKGCPLADAGGDDGCSVFPSFGRACQKYRNKNGYSKFNVPMHPCEEFEKRAQFFDRILPIIKAWPESRFTQRGWRYSGDEIPRSW